MANDNKKINDLVSESDDDTSELEVLSEASLNETDVEFEADAATYAFESLGKPDHDSIAALRSALHERDSNLERLEYELEQLRSRSKGLQKELEARTELTGKLTAELEQQKTLLGETREFLEDRDRLLSEARSQLQQAEGRVQEADGELETSRTEARAAAAAYKKLEKQQAADVRELVALRANLAEERVRRTEAEDTERTLAACVAEFETRQRASQESIASLNDYIQGRKARWEEQEALLRTRETALQEQQKNVERLTRDVRHATDRLHDEKTGREDAETRLAAAEGENGNLQNAMAELKASLAGKDQVLGSLREDMSALKLAADEASRERQQALEQNRERGAQLDKVRADNAALRGELEAANDAIAEKDRSLAEVREAIAALEQLSARTAAELEKERQQRAALTNDLGEARQAQQSAAGERDSLAASMDSLRAEADELRGAAAKAAELEKSGSQLAGLVASQESTLEQLRDQLAKTEAYADTLRDKLQRQLSIAESEAGKRDRLEERLQTAGNRLDELEAALDRERRQNAELNAKLAEADKRLEDELRQLRFELDEAQETIADNQNVNEQLTADLVDSSGRRRTLETQLTELDEARQYELRKVSDELARFKLKVEDYEQKLAHKDAALKALLSEFANKPRKASPDTDQALPEKDAEDSVHRLRSRKAGEDGVAAERDRVTRLLVGTIDGQKLRFPLFKDKLTIGRTAHNDIQIKAHYISRRHAVVVTEDEQTRIVDWGSKNGVYVNGSRVTEKALRNGDVVTVGTAEFIFEERPKR